MKQAAIDHVDPDRFRLVTVVFGIVLLAIIIRLGYWQIIRSPSLRAEAQTQYERLVINRGRRGAIKTVDGYTLVSSEQQYRLYFQPNRLDVSASELSMKLSKLLLPVYARTFNATESATSTLTQLDELIRLKASKESKWVSVLIGLHEEERQAVASLKLTGVGTEPYFAREYPEGSLASEVVGFVGKNDQGSDVGYFGIEGVLDRELSGQFSRQLLPTILPGLSLPNSLINTSPQDGRQISLTIRRDIQYLAESELQAGIERYQAKSGEVIIMEPSTGKILAMASSPSYDPAHFSEFDTALYKNPSVTAGYEPGSTLKTLTVAAGIDAGVISSDTQCPNCDGPRKIAGYTLKTWNNEYHPGITMTDALAKSDNVAMIYVADQLGAEKLRSYLQAFGLGNRTGIELQEDTSPPFPGKWGPVELATISFGQGISTTTLQVLKAINAIANQGKVMRPMLVDRVVDPVSNEVLITEPIVESQAITSESARKVTQMMVNAAQHGEAQWTVSADHWVAAKTGTSQVPVEGGYAEDRTIASFVGFAPPDNPKFIMIVKLVEPQTSPWAAETAAPLWYKIASKLFLLLSLPPDRNSQEKKPITPQPSLKPDQAATTSAAITHT